MDFTLFTRPRTSSRRSTRRSTTKSAAVRVRCRYLCKLFFRRCTKSYFLTSTSKITTHFVHRKLSSFLALSSHVNGIYYFNNLSKLILRNTILKPCKLCYINFNSFNFCILFFKPFLCNFEQRISYYMTLLIFPSGLGV